MNLPHPSTAGSPVGLWFVDGLPVRLVHDARRYRVVREQLFVEGDTDRWQLSARDEAGRVRFFEIRSAGLGWELVRAS